MCLRERRVRFKSVVGLGASGMIFTVAVFSIRFVPRRERLIVQYLHYGHTRILVTDMVGKVVLAYSASLRKPRSLTPLQCRPLMMLDYR